MPKTTVSEPTSWPKVTTTYATITSKLKEPASTSQKLEAIDYWTARLKEDRAAIAKGEPARDG